MVNLSLYTSIHALKSKKSKMEGAMSESTTVLNINTTAQPSDLSSSNTTAPAAPLTAPSKGGISSQDQPSVEVSVPTASDTAVASSKAVPKSLGGNGAVKAQTDKKKIDARKKSLKRL
ncbi:hypothetical protein GIB67_024747 [Kingdonia uniflora]|uniref:Uncharacterized protein n=1 Tax=Kingdonia uniflora TaxID=39325 RepID=A0A7J7NA68_9MAGN|nr:hypothetical protein GIB67_024747 [Kingdonia uniflora]